MNLIIRMIKAIYGSILFLALLVLVTGCKKEEKPPEPITDIDGNIYKTVKIGTQILMAENLRTTRLNDGSDILLIINNKDWSELTTPGYCWYNNDETYKDPYGALYNGFAACDSNICPVGWHVPSFEEWEILRTFLGDSAIAGGKLKEAGTDHWLSPNKGATNSSGLTGLGSGVRYLDGAFASVLNYTGIWSSTETSNIDEWFMGLYYGDASFTSDHRAKTYGLTIRCIRD